jgi:hypothetical protein
MTDAIIQGLATSIQDRTEAAGGTHGAAKARAARHTTMADNWHKAMVEFSIREDGT